MLWEGAVKGPFSDVKSSVLRSILLLEIGGNIILYYVKNNCRYNSDICLIYAVFITDIINASCKILNPVL